MTETRYLAIDPGLTSGWASYENGINQAGELPFQEMIDFAEAWMYENYQRVRPGAILLERFVVSQRTVQASRGDTNWSMETIGACRWLAHRYDHSFGLLNASDAKNFATDELLKALNWYRPGKPHGNDAQRILALGISQAEPSLWRRWVLSSGLLTEDNE